MAENPGKKSLTGTFVCLDASVHKDAADLLTALDDDRVWPWFTGPDGRPRSADDWKHEIDNAARQERAMFTVRLREGGQVIGTTSLGRIELVHERLELGWTAYAPKHWGGVVNPECKLLMLGHAFDCGFGRVQIHTDVMNTRSQAAISRLGAVREGVLRRFGRRGDGTFRDLMVFSILRDEWPAVRSNLEARLAFNR